MKKCIIVLGMHRSGTSAVTKAVESLGVNLGDNLIPAAEDNKKGFFEDRQIIDINDRLLKLAGMKWYSVEEFPTYILDSPQGKSLEVEARRLICNRLEINNIWGFKDPRCSRLLPFWQNVLGPLDVEVGFLMVLRNPLDMASSIKKRDRFDLTMSQHLWLLHTFLNLKYLKSERVFFVLFDDFLDHPESYLERLTAFFNLEPDREKTDRFTRNFLDRRMRHSHSTLGDLAGCPGIFPFVYKLYALLHEMAIEKRGIESLFLNWDELESEYLKTTSKILLDFCFHAQTRNRDVENLAGLLSRNVSIIERQSGQMEDLREELDQILHSTSWHVTKPLRQLGLFLNKRKLGSDGPLPDSIQNSDQKIICSDRADIKKSTTAVSLRPKLVGTGIKKRIGNMISYNPEIYEKILAHGQRKTILGCFMNAILSLGYKSAFVLKRKLSRRFEFIKTKQVAQEKFVPWEKPLTKVSENKGRRILIIAEVNLSQCYKYRVQQKKEMFEFLGYESTVCKWNDSEKARHLIQTHGLVLFYRVPGFDSVKWLLEECDRLGLETFFEVDDLIFDMDEYAKNSNNLSLSDAERKELLNGVDLYRHTLEHCRHAIASTPVVAEFMKKYCKGRIYIVENCLDQQLSNLGQEMQHLGGAENKDEIVIGYGSGTTTHDVDFQECAEALTQVLMEYPQVKLAVHGHLKLPESLLAYEDRIYRVPFLHSDDYYRALSGFDINLAPLERSLFNDAKSNIKFLEAAIFGVPTVASPGAAFLQVIENRQNGVICRSTQEWCQALSDLVADEAFRKKMGEKAKETVLSMYDYRKVAEHQVLPIIKNHFPSEKKKKKILMVNVLFSPMAFGGATIVMEQLSVLLHQNYEMDVTVFTGFWDDCGTGIPNEEVVRYESLGLPVIAVRLPGGIIRENEYRNQKIADRFTDILKSVQPDIVHFHSIQQMGAGLAESCRELNIPYIITLHDAWWLCERQFMVMKNGCYCEQSPVEPRFCVQNCTEDSAHTYARYYYLRKILKGAALLLTPSIFQQQFYIRNGFNETQVRVNKNGVFPPKDSFIRTKSRKTRFAYLGGNAVHKGYEWLKSIFESIDDPNYSINIVDCQKKIGLSVIKPSDWKIKGELILSEGFDQQCIDEFFSCIDVLLFPSQWKESFGLTVREALIRDIWIIATDSGGTVEDIIPGENGQIFARNDSIGFRQAVIDAIQNPSDRINPYKEKIRLFPEQAKELNEFYETLI